jgi:hypothetical protein
VSAANGAPSGENLKLWFKNLALPQQRLITQQLLIKGTVQRQLTGGLSGINRKHMNCHCSDGYPFFNLKGLRSLKSENVFSAA